MRVIATADTHGQLPYIPRCDLLIVAGDVCPIIDHDKGYQQQWLKSKFVPWLEQVEAHEIVWIAGNHDFVLENYHWVAAEMKRSLKFHYLQDEGININGLEIWGTPWTPHLPGWAFSAEGEPADAIFDKIPETVDILVSHGPPVGYGDRVSHAGHVGSDELLAACKHKRPRYVICGHIHEGYGQYHTKWGGELFNVSHNNEYYEAVNPPVEIDIQTHAELQQINAGMQTDV